MFANKIQSKMKCQSQWLSWPFDDDEWADESQQCVVVSFSYIKTFWQADYLRLYELKHQHLTVCRLSKTYKKSASISKPQILHHAHQVKCNYLFFLAVSMKCSFSGVIN